MAAASLCDSRTRSEPSSTITPYKSRVYNIFRFKYITDSELSVRETRIHTISIAIILLKKDIHWLSAVCSMQIIVLINFMVPSGLSFV